MNMPRYHSNITLNTLKSKLDSILQRLKYVVRVSEGGFAKQFVCECPSHHAQFFSQKSGHSLLLAKSKSLYFDILQ